MQPSTLPHLHVEALLVCPLSLEASTLLSYTVIKKDKASYIQNNPSRVLSTPTGTRGIFLSQMRSLRYERHASGGIHASLQHSLYFLLSKISEVLGLLSALSNRMRMRGSQASLEDSARTGARNQLSSAQLAMGCFQLKAKEKKAQILKLTAR